MQTRHAAAGVIQAVLKGASLTTALPPVLNRINNPRDNAFIQALCYGTCRWYFELDAILSTLLETPLKAKDQDIQVLLLLGLFQLLHSNVPHHAAITETVSCVPRNKIWAKGLVNAILRRCQREMPFAAFPTHPEWWQNKLRQTWPQHYENIMTANNQHPPFHLRVHLKKIAREGYLAELNQAGLTAHFIPETHSGIQLEQPVPVTQLPHFEDGWVSVQDGAAQLAAPFLAPLPGERILDACAAPGGKTTHLLEWQPELAELIAIDCDKERLNQVRENLQRLQLDCTLTEADAGNPSSWWDGRLFDRILLDAPCSASGVVRRHPDIRLLRQEKDIAQLAAEQLRLLRALWPTLKSGGVLLYVTCSVFSEENSSLLASFLSSEPTACEEKIPTPLGHSCPHGLQILPGSQGMDGFYYALLRKN